MGLRDRNPQFSALRAPHSALPSPWRTLERFGELDSTQLEAGRRLEAGESMSGIVLWAERQSSGRGRRDHGWVSEPGGFYATVGLPYDLPLTPADAGWISLLAALAAAETLGADLGVDMKIKWPNDLIVRGCKVGGLLGEVRSLAGGGRQILIGLGLNWANPVELADPSAASAPPGSLAQFHPELSPARREEFLLGWLARLNGWRARLGLDYDGALWALREEIEAILWRKGEPVRFRHTERGSVEGRLLGLAAGGAARLESAQGGEFEVHCGWQNE